MIDSVHIKNLAAELGFAICGVAEAQPTDFREELRAWLEAGKHATMDWLARHVEVREDPAELLEGARSVICVGDFIGRRHRPHDVQAPLGRVARYAQVDDYHKVMKKRLHELVDLLRIEEPEADFRACVDTAPVLEHEHAMRAGIGWTGKHTLTIHPRVGSYVMLGEVFTTLRLTLDTPQTDHCGTCTRCIDACPTDCITPYSVDASRCISYLTIEHREAINPAFFESIDDWLYGCDICQEVCPFNEKGRSDATQPEVYNERPSRLNVLDVLAWTEQDRREAFVRSAMKRAKLHQMKRNALVVLANRIKRGDADAALIRRIIAIEEDADEHPVVRQTAADVLAYLNA